MVAVGFDAARYCCGLYGSRLLSPSSIPEIVSVVKQSSGMIASAAEGRFWLAFWENVLNLSNARNGSPGASTLDIDAGPLESPLRRIGLVLRAVSLTVALLRAGGFDL